MVGCENKINEVHGGRWERKNTRTLEVINGVNKGREERVRRGQRMR